jgi:DNA-binding Lrp family transcriptional regulator
MAIRDETDRRLIAELRRDGRAALTTLAGRLGVSRGTVQSRLERLLTEGVIRGFTVRLNEAYAPETIRAIMMIEVEGSSTRSVISALRRMPEITELHTTNGAWDLVAEIRTSNLPEFDRLLREVRTVRGVLNSETSLLLDTV